jgi:hypothetical protein
MSSIVFRGRDRERAILLIAGSIDDFGSWLADPRGALMGKTPSGLAPGVKVPCEKCERGQAKDKFGREQACVACEGRGWQWEDSGLRGVPVQAEDTKAAPTKQPKTRRCLDCSGDGALPNGRRCRSCRGEGRIVVDAFVIAEDRGGEKDPLDAYTAAIERRDKSGSYGEFQVLEAELRARSPHLLTPFREVHVTVPRRDLGSLTEREREFVVRARDWFLEWMPSEVVVPRWVVVADEAARASRLRVRGKGVAASQREVRDREIIRRFRAGEASKDIALSVGLDVSRVNRIVYAEREVA